MGKEKDVTYATLATSTLTDADVDNLDNALFLFALRIVQGAPVDELPAIRARYADHWRVRMEPEAFGIVKGEFGRLLKEK